MNNRVNCLKSAILLPGGFKTFCHTRCNIYDSRVGIYSGVAFINSTVRAVFCIEIATAIKVVFDTSGLAIYLRFLYMQVGRMYFKYQYSAAVSHIRSNISGPTYLIEKLKCLID